MNLFYYDRKANIYPTQLEAIKSGKPCLFYYYDKEMLQIDWKTEPVESLSEFYRMRAQQIRDENQYVIVCFSGGIDSTNVLESFYYNNIHIDEILVVGALSQDLFKGSDENHNGDLYHNVFPLLNSLHLPNTKITVKDYTEIFSDPTNFTLIQKYGNEWAKHTGAYRSVHHLFWYDLKKFIGREHGKQTCYVMGSDKPFISIIDDKPCVRFNDLSINDYGANYEDDHFRRINFYNGTDEIVAKLMRKQAHVVLRNLNSNFIENFSLLPAERDKAFLKRLDDVASMVYNVRNPLKHISTKSSLTAISARDKYLLSKSNSEIYKWFTEGLQTIKKYGEIDVKYSFSTRPYWLT